MLRRSEQAVGAAVVAVLIAGLLGLGAPTRVVPATPTAAQSAVQAPSPSPTRTPQPVRKAKVARPRPKPRRAARPVPAAFPRTGCPVPTRHATRGGGGLVVLARPAVGDTALPALVPVKAKARSLYVVRGKGLWATPMATTHLDVVALVAKARRTGVRSLWVRTGGSRQGYYGNHFLPRLVPAAHAAGLAVVAWDFPNLSNPVADSTRAARALAAGVDAFSPDIETASEGTHLTQRRVAVYLSRVRRYAGRRPVVATVPRPTARPYPYGTVARYADVFAPMVYWSCHEPGALVHDAVARLRHLLPVAPIGQAYDMGSEGGRVGTPSRLETLRFLDAARRAGAIGASLWTVEAAGKPQLAALAVFRWPVLR
jgi:hypothetical protein